MSGRRPGPVQLPEAPEKVKDLRRKLRRALEFLDESAGDLEPENLPQAREAVGKMRRKLDLAEAAFGEEALAEERQLVERVAEKLGLP